MVHMVNYLRWAPRGAVLLSLAVAGCATQRQVDPPRTATEELLVTRAVDRSVAHLQAVFPPGSKVFLDTAYFDTDGVVLPKYTEGAVRDQLLRLGVAMVDDRKTADVVVELRTGAQSIDFSNFLIGIPSVPLPIPFAGTLQTPEIAFFKITRQTGVSKLALTAWSEKSGGLVASTGPQYGASLKKDLVVLFVSWSDSDVKPPQSAREDVPQPAVSSAAAR
jgi:hypothetical protein